MTAQFNTNVFPKQIAKGLFNRGKLLNIGFTEAEKDYPYDCYLFHDIDQILENDKNLYRCRERPMHLSRFYSAKDYKEAARFGKYAFQNMLTDCVIKI